MIAIFADNLPKAKSAATPAHQPKEPVPVHAATQARPPKALWRTQPYRVINRECTYWCIRIHRFQLGLQRGPNEPAGEVAYQAERAQR